MKITVQEIVEQFVPYVILGVAIALVIGLFIMLSHVFLWGLLLGAILWIGITIKNYVLPSTTSTDKKGRVIEHRDKD
jgi:hypothetical protein